MLDALKKLSPSELRAMEERLISEVHAARRVDESATATYKQATRGRHRDNGLSLAAAGIPSVVESAPQRRRSPVEGG